MARIALAVLTFGALYGLYRLVHVAVGGFPEEVGLNAQRYSDLILLYALIPAYFMAASGFARTRSDVAYASLSRLLDGADAPDKDDYIKIGWILGAALLGLGYGIFDMRLGTIDDFSSLALLWTLKVGNGLVWASVGAIFSWRLCYARLFVDMGDVVRVDLLDMGNLKPLARVASLDVFVTMGAMAMMPLQSVSSEFQWEYYRAGFVFGIPAAIAFLVLPQLGVHRNIRRCKQLRQVELNQQIHQTDLADVAALEPLLAHRQRIDEMPEWPMDTRALSRVVLYLIVPPLAWVGAAIVEKGVDQLF